MTGREESRETLIVRKVDAQSEAIDLRLIPRDRKRNRRIEQDVEVVRIARMLPEVVGVNQNVFSDRLLKACIELMPSAGLETLSRGIAKDSVTQPCGSSRIRKDQILVIGRLEGPAIGAAQHSSRLLDQIGRAKSRFPQMPFAQSRVDVEAQTEIRG